MVASTLITPSARILMRESTSISHHNAVAFKCDLAKLMIAMKKEAADQLRQALSDVMKSRNLTVSGWCRQAGIPESTLRNFLHGRSETLTHASLVSLSGAISESVSAILGEAPLSSAGWIYVEREIKRDWQEYYRLDTRDRLHLVMPYDLRFPGARRFGAILSDNSADLKYPSGTILICADLYSSDIKLSHGDVVVCEKEKIEKDKIPDEDGYPSFLYKNSVMIYAKGDNGEKKLSSISNDILLNEVVDLKYYERLIHDKGRVPTYVADDHSIQIVALVIASYRFESRADGISMLRQDRSDSRVSHNDAN